MNISRIEKAKDFTKNNQIKDEQRVVSRDLDRIMGRWNGYSDKLLNGENHCLSLRMECQMMVEHNASTGMRYRRVTLSRMKKGETTEWLGFQMMCRCVRETKDWHVINLMQSVYEQENISTQGPAFCPGLKKGMVLIEEKGHFCS